MVRATLIRQIGALAARVLRRYRPVIIGVTGSVGKTSAANAAVAVLAAGGLRVRGARRNYNNELGLPLTVLGADAPGRSPTAWASLTARALGLLTRRDPHYPTHLVLEYGADHPGDIARLTALARPSVAVVTAVSAAHLEFFGSVEAVAREKGTLVEALPSDGTAVLNQDDPRALAMRERTTARAVTYGFAPEATVRAVGTHIAMTPKHEPLGMRWNLRIGTDAAEVVTPGTLGRGPIAGALAGAAVGVALGLDFWSIHRGVSAWRPSPGRMRLLVGRGGALLIDDTYNSSPRAARVALQAFADLRMSIPERRRATVVLGAMAELGPDTERLHRTVGEAVAAINPDRLVTVGAVAEALADGAVAAGLPADRVHRFPDAASAAQWLVQQIAAGDLVLLKGSQSARCERITRALLADPADAPRALVRQSADWQNRA